jgi:lipopolysaccharide export system permease protein
VAALPILLFNYVGLTLGENVGDTGRVAPWIAMWGPNIVIGAVAVYLLRATLRERPIPIVTFIQQSFWVLVAQVQASRRRVSETVTSPASRATGSARPRVRARRTARSNALHIVDRYLSAEFLTLFLYGIALATVVVIIGDLMTTLDRYLRLKPGLWLIVLHFVYRTPPFVYQGLHIVMLMSTILLFVGLSRSNELTALKAGGVSLYRVSLPVFGLAGLVTISSLGFQEVVMPFMNRRAVEIDESKIKRRTMPELRKRTQLWYRGREDGAAESRIYHIELLDPGNRQMNGVTVLSLGSDFGMRRRWDAREMRWSDAEDAWRMANGVRREFRSGRPELAESFREQTVRLPERYQDFAQVPKAPDVMNYVELREYIDRLQAAGHKVGKYLVDLYSKIAFPFAHPIMALVGIPFALQSPRGGRVIGIAVCLALGLGYFIVHSAALALARAEILPPLVAAWAANALFATLGLYLYLRART